MNSDLKYIELKTGYADNGPAWIGKVKLSKSGNTVYFNDKAFRKCQGISGNYYDVETLEEYWISGIKKKTAPTGIGQGMERSLLRNPSCRIILR
ncbi:MAG: hypothetical protein FWE08_05050 [Oscillospiraceae bacterium]|nr:hypothetical protein [Oscillospiraceae bacterium]